MTRLRKASLILIGLFLINTIQAMEWCSYPFKHIKIILGTSMPSYYFLQKFTRAADRKTFNSIYRPGLFSGLPAHILIERIIPLARILIKAEAHIPRSLLPRLRKMGIDISELLVNQAIE